MRIQNYLFIVLTCVLSAVATTELAHADDNKRIRELQRAGQILSLEKIFDAARAVKPGRILKTKLDKDDGQYIYEIELLDSRGWVWKMEFDARTGELFELKRDD